MTIKKKAATSITTRCDGIMKILRLAFISMSVHLISGCNLVSDEIRRSFDTVNNSISKSSQYSGVKLKTIYSGIDSNRLADPALAKKADSVYDGVQATNLYIDRLKSVLQLNDSTGQKLGLAEKLIISKPAGDSLIKGLANVSRLCRLNLVDPDARPALDSALKDIDEMVKDRKSLDSYFHSLITVAAVTILAKFQNDCINAGVIVLTDIKMHQKRSIL